MERHLVNICCSNTQSSCVTGQIPHQVPQLCGAPETPTVENRKQKELFIKGFLSPE